MTATTGWQRKVVLLFKSERTLNAKKIINTFNDKSIDEMKATIITEQSCDATALTHKPKVKDLQTHLENLKHQFIGRSELCFYHAALVVLLRRKYKVEEIYSYFEQLWITEHEYLLNHLSLRWVVSACDTFIDHTKDSVRAAILMNVITLMNTLRVYETKYFLKLPTNSESMPLIDDKVTLLYCGDMPLYDGLTYFRIGTDDSLKNMRSRYETFDNIDKLATTILLSVFDKLQNNDSAFATLRLLHNSGKSKWWSDTHP